MVELKKGDIYIMSTKKRSIFMTNVYTSPPTKRYRYLAASKQDRETLQIEIAEGFSDCCTKSLLAMLRQMNKDITHFIITDLTSKGSE